MNILLAFIDFIYNYKFRDLKVVCSLKTGFCSMSFYPTLTNYSIELSNYKTNIKTRSPNLLIHVCILTFWQNKFCFVIKWTEILYNYRYLTIRFCVYHEIQNFFLWFKVFFSKKRLTCTVQTVYQVLSLLCILSFHVCILSLTSKGTDKASI